MKNLIFVFAVMVAWMATTAQNYVDHWTYSDDLTKTSHGFNKEFDANGMSATCGSFGNTTISFAGNSYTNTGFADGIVFVADENNNPYWGVHFTDGNSDDYNSATSVAWASNGDLFITIRFDATVTIGTQTYTCVGTQDLVIARYSSNGNYIDSWQLEGGILNCHHLEVDDSYVFLGGSVVGTASSSGTTLVTSHGNTDGMILIFDYSGNFQWGQAIGAISSTNGQSISLDSNGDVYISGYSNSGTVQFGNGITITVPGGYVHQWGAKYNSSGVCQWAVDLGNHMHMYVASTDNHVYFSGYCGGLIKNADGSSAVVIDPYDGNENIFVARYSKNGYYQGHDAYWSNNDTELSGIDAKPDGTWYITGTARDSIFDGETNDPANLLAYVMSSIGTKGAPLLISGDATETRWGYALDDESYAHFGTGEDIAVHGDNVYLSGRETGTINLNVTGGTNNVTNTAFVVKYFDGDAPIADFAGNPTSGDAPLVVSFTDLSTGTINSWSWNFGDGGSSSLQNPSHTYNAPGTYTVSLTVTNFAGSDTETKTGYIVVTQPSPVADFSGNPTSGSDPLVVNFTDLSVNNPNSWSWSFGDGGSSTLQNPNHTYNEPGVYTVNLTVSNSGGSDTETKVDYITVNATAPGANFSGSPTSGYVPLDVQFTDLSSAGSYPITSWSWDFGDGNTSNEQYPLHTYSTAGSYTVSLTVSDGSLSDTETKTNYISVNNEPPIANFVGNPLNGYAPLDVYFTDESSQGTYPITSWSWNFGDGNTSTEENPIHTYDTPGDYTVSLTVSDGSLSDMEVKTNYVSVSAVGAPIADFSADPTRGSETLTTQFTDESQEGTYSIVSWSWDFGDGNTSIEQNPVHTYGSPGIYTVSLTVSDGNLSDTETKVDYIEVYEVFEGGAGDDQGLYVGQTTQLEGWFTGGSGNVEIEWVGIGNSISISDPYILDPVVGPFNTTDVYYFEITIEDMETEEVIVDTMFIDVITGIDEMDKMVLTIFPNPTTGTLFIDTGKASDVSQVSVKSMSGTVVFKREGFLNEKIQIDLSHLNCGFYFVNVIFSDGSRTIQKVVKQ